MCPHIGIFVTSREYLFAFDDKGNEAWVAELVGAPLTPAVSNESLDVVAVGSRDLVQAFSILSGDESWRKEVNDLSGLTADWARFYATDRNGLLSSWFMNGVDAWSSEIPDNAFPAIPSPENVMIVSQDGNLVNLDSETGELNYELTFNAKFSPDLPPFVSGDWLYGRNDNIIGAIAPEEP